MRVCVCLSVTIFFSLKHLNHIRKGDSRVLQGCFKSLSRVFLKVFQECFECAAEEVMLSLRFVHSSFYFEALEANFNVLMFELFHICFTSVSQVFHQYFISEVY